MDWLFVINVDNPILVDVDDCIADFMGSCLRLAADKFNIFAKPEDCTKDPYWDALGCPTLEAVIDHEILHREFCYQIKPISAGIQFLRELESLYGTDNVLICTSPWKFDSRQTATGEWASQRYAWLRDVAKVPRDRVIMAKRKRHVQGILIDDSVKNCQQRPVDKSFCIAQPYNTDWLGNRGTYKDCLSWLESIK